MEPQSTQSGDLTRRLWPFFAVLAIFWAVSGYWWYSLGYEGTFRWLNSFHVDALDTAALYVFTHFADGLILPGIIFLLFWRKDPVLAITAFIAILLTGFLTQFGKIVIFPEWHRPPVVFANDPLVDILHPNPPSSRSFPSGHATSATTGGLFFALLLSRWRIWLSGLVGVFTLFVASTRVIIGVHFPGDIFIGSIIGSVGGLLVFIWLYPLLSRRLHRLRNAQSGRVAMVVAAVAVVAIVGQYIHLMIRT